MSASRELKEMCDHIDLAYKKGNLANKKAKYDGYTSGVISLRDHIDQHHSGNQSDYAREIGVTKQQITKWLKNEVIMVNGSMYTPVKSKPKG